MKTKPMALFGILMIALSVVGFAYAHWSGEIHINGEAKMGELIFGFTTCGNCTDGKMLPDGTIVWPEPKDTGNVTCELKDPETSKHLEVPKTVYKTMLVNITDGYPEYVARCNFTLDNGGSIPLDVTRYCVTIDYGGLTWGWVSDVIVGRDAEGNATINVWFDPMFFGQIDPCESKQSAIFIHIKEPALPCHTYQFKITIHASQWDP